MKIKFPTGVLWGEDAKNLLQYAKDNHFALPAINIIGTHSLNSVLQAAKEANSPIIIQLSSGGAHFYAGKGLDNSDNTAMVAGAISAAKHVHTLAEQYGVSVILHTDHANKSLLSWVSGMLDYGEEYFAKHGRPLFSSHMIDLSAEPLEENVAISKQFLQRTAQIGMMLEVEIGITGGEEDGVEHSDLTDARLYTQPEDVVYSYREFSEISSDFTLAVAFGNVHGVYKPGNVQLEPILLKKAQDAVQQEFDTGDLPLNLVFHGGSGSESSKIQEALQYGVIKMNIDTDTQWAFCEWVREYFDEFSAYLQSQIGNPEGVDQPNKKKYDPRAWLRKGEESMIHRVKQACDELGSTNQNI